MAGGHTSEKRWAGGRGQTGVSTLVSELCKQMIAALTDASAAFAEMLEIYNYNGNSIQGLADQLFYEDWSARGVAGVQATVVVDVTAGVVSNPVISVAGTGYEDGLGNQTHLTVTAAGDGAGGAKITYDVVGGVVTNVVVASGGTGYTDGLAQTVVDMPAPTNLIYETEANAEELAKTQDLFDAVTALNEMHKAANNEAVLQEDRYSQMRRMS